MPRRDALPFPIRNSDALMPLDIGGASSHRTYVLVGLVLGGVALVGVSTGVLVGLAGSDQPEPARRTTSQALVAPSEAAPSPTASARRPTTPADSDIEPGRRSDVGYFLAASTQDDGVHVTFDRVQLVATGVVNQNARTRELVLAPDVVVPGGLEPLLDALPTEGSVRLLELAYDSLGYVTEIHAKSVP